MYIYIYICMLSSGHYLLDTELHSDKEASMFVHDTSDRPHLVTTRWMVIMRAGNWVTDFTMRIFCEAADACTDEGMHRGSKIEWNAEFERNEEL